MLTCIDSQDLLRNRQAFDLEIVQEENAACSMIHIIVGRINVSFIIEKIDDQIAVFRKRGLLLYDEVVQKGQYFCCSFKNVWILEVSICENSLKKT